jgi:hypothetical protein
MFGLDIFATVDRELLRKWLRSVLLPLLVAASFFESMGFEPWFVRRFLHKHAKVLRFDGTTGPGRGISELEFLRGVAEALGVRRFEDAWDPRDTVTTTAVAQKCLEALAAIESNRAEADSAGRTPDVATPPTASVAGVQS